VEPGDVPPGGASGIAPGEPTSAELQVEPCVPFEPCLLRTLAPEDAVAETYPCVAPCDVPEDAPAEIKRRAEEICADPCAAPAGDETACLPPDCAVSSDGAVACPEPVLCDDTPDGAGRCLPPECAIADDGSVSCKPSEGGGSGAGGTAPAEPGVIEPALP
jgi:hypothetical protein